MRQATAPGQGELRQVAGASLLLVGAGGVAGLLNLLFNVVVARQGGASDYGAIGPLLTLVTVVGLIATGFQYGIARQAAVSLRGPVHLLGPAFRSVLPWAAAATLLAVLSWPLSGFLRLHSPVPVLLVAALATLSVLGAAVSGLLVGFRRFKVIGALGVGAAVLRLGLGFLVGHGSGTVTLSLIASLAAVAASFLAGLLVLTITARSFKASPSRSAADTAKERSGRAGIVGALIAGALWTTWGLPVLFARHTLDAGLAGDFAASQLLAGALIWGTAPIVTAFFPTIARHRTRRTFLYGELATLLIALLGSVGLTALGPLMVGHLYGPGFTGSRSVLVMLAISATATACATFAAWAAMAGSIHLGGVLASLGVAVASEVLWDALVARGPITLALAPMAALCIGATTFLLFVRRMAPDLDASPNRSADSLASTLAPERVGTEP